MENRLGLLLKRSLKKGMYPSVLLGDISLAHFFSKNSVPVEVVDMLPCEENPGARYVVSFVPSLLILHALIAIVNTSIKVDLIVNCKSLLVLKYERSIEKVSIN